ncbi:hypothetical protein EPN52_12945 [bacterium]|nr:MAG: hypothetical protein EPN52_12945 [bacterium]
MLADKAAAVTLTIAITALALIGVSKASAGQMFTQDVTPLYAAAQGSGGIGSLSPGTAVMPSGTPQAAHARSEVVVEGWSIQGADAVLYSAVGRRIVLATLETAAPQETLIAEQRDDYGTVWRHVRLVGWVDATHLVPDAASVWSSAQKLYAARCSACHALHAPAEFTANQWPGILRTMVRNAALDPEQTALVTRYLQEHARAQ